MRNARKRAEQQALISSSRQELMALRSQLEQAYTIFNASADPDVVEASILEISALQSKYSRMLRNFKHFDEA